MGTHYRGSKNEIRALDAYIKLARAADTVQTRLDEGLARLGYTENQFGVLEMLLHLGPLHQHEIGGKLLLSRANVTLLVDQLSAKGLVRRQRDQVDRRKVSVSLTAEGRRRTRRAFPRHVENILSVFSGLSGPEQEELARLCRKLGHWAAANVSRENPSRRGGFSREKSPVVD